MLNREQKKQIISRLVSDLKKAKAVVFSGFQGLKASEVQKLRSDLNKAEVNHKVVKLSLLRRALNQLGIDSSSLSVNVPLSVSLSFDDEVAPAKVLNDFAKSNEKLEIVSGILEQQIIDQGQVKALAALPGKQELRGQVVSVIAGPLRGLASVLQGNLRELVYALKAVEESKS